MNHEAARALHDQALNIHNELRQLSAQRKTLHWDLETNRKRIATKQALLRANKAARKALKEEE